MKSSPAFQFYAAEYLADENVALMSLEEEGAYIRAIAFCWREGSIPADPDKLSKLLKGASTTVVRVVQERFKRSSEDASRLVHPRLEIEREKQRAWKEKSSEGGKKSSNNKKNKGLFVQPPLKNGSTTLQPPNQGWRYTSSSSSITSSFENPADEDP